MPTIRTHLDDVAWTPAIEMFGDGAFYDGSAVIEVKRLSDRRAEGGGVAHLQRVSPPPGKLIKIVAVARSDEHVFNLGGGRTNKAGKPVVAPGGYTLNPKGQPHSAMIATETTALVIYAGEPDEVTSVEVLDIEPAPGKSGMSGDPLVTLSDVRDPVAETVVAAGLAAFNKEAFGRVDTRTLDILVRDGDSGEVVGGLLGHSSLGLFFLDLFYLPAELRGGGMGSRIIRLAEDEARRRGCTQGFVYTVTFQAPGFYERHGYRRFGEIACPPDGATRIFLTKPLD